MTKHKIEFKEIIRQLRDLDWKLWRGYGLRIRLLAESSQFNKNNFGIKYQLFFNPHYINLKNYYTNCLLILNYYCPSK